jgi:hypothetical protein
MTELYNALTMDVRVSFLPILLFLRRSNEVVQPSEQRHRTTGRGTIRSRPRVDRRPLKVSVSLLPNDVLIRFIQSIIKAESLALVGADIFKTKFPRTNGAPHSKSQHRLPHPAQANDKPRYNSKGDVVYSPNWILGPKADANAKFIHAVVDAVQLVQVRQSLTPVIGS